MQKQYEKFLETKQDNLKLSLALQGYLTEEALSFAEREAYRAYLKKRIRPAVSALLEQGEAEKIVILEKEGFFGRKELDEFLKMAQEKGQYAAWIRLLKMKQEKYGFPQEELSL
ncbi:MAG: hypothetical protein Q4E91_02690 [Lachnospiraceae bacterium]|nr:hypothetical protein [Lachnospiraceae bacterium]